MVCSPVAGGPQPAPPGGVPQEAGQRPDLDRPPARVGLLDLESRAVDVGLVDVHGDARLAVQPGGEADVVGIPVREDERPHVAEALAHRGQLGLKWFPVARQPGVDDRDAVLTGDQVAVDDVRADPAQAADNLHDNLPRLYVLRVRAGLEWPTRLEAWNLVISCVPG